MGDSILSTVRKAAKFAVYEEIIIKVKNHHIPATILVDIDLGIRKKLALISFYQSILKREIFFLLWQVRMPFYV